MFDLTHEALRAAAARSLEDGRFQGMVARCLSAAWGEVSARSVARPLAMEEHAPHARIVCVGGATLGGSGKTPLAVACARVFAEKGARVALVGHAYRARPGFARVVSPGDPLSEVGDEALVAARALAPHGVRVVVGPSRGLAVALAGREANVLVLDGVLQTVPARASLSLLAVDFDEPWGRTAAVPPRGDLRAPPGALLAATDALVRIGEGPEADAHIRSKGVHFAGTLLAWEAIRRLRVGLVCALARPARLLRFLARRGITPVAMARAADHGKIPARVLGRSVDIWLATHKCAFHVGITHAPLATIDHELELSGNLVTRLETHLATRLETLCASPAARIAGARLDSQSPRAP